VFAEESEQYLKVLVLCFIHCCVSWFTVMLCRELDLKTVAVHQYSNIRNDCFQVKSNLLTDYNFVGHI
jgi:hypothetical protein